MEQPAVHAANGSPDALISHSFYPERFFDMVGVTGSIPVAPTIAPTNVSWRSSPRVFQADAVEERSRSEHHADG